MKKLMGKHRKFTQGNKGFSLVELIIVIAIMAALISILAPQMLKYVEKSREAADATTMDEIFKAAQVAVADSESGAVGDGILNVKIGTDGSITIEEPATGPSGIADDVNAMFGTSGLMKSKDAKALGTKTIVVDLDSGVSWGSSFTIGDAAFGS
jgi:prepilin-type N-terminal cleavage/methylation domain-containing protein